MAPKQYDFTGKTVFVTGGSRGIGAGIVRLLAQYGAGVALCYHQQAKAAEELVKSLESAPGKVKAYACDVRSRQQVRDVLARIAADFGDLDVLVNNAGLNRHKRFEETTDEDWDAVLDTNLKGPFICCQEALPYLKNSSAGRIINISSIASQLAGPNTVQDAVSKNGLDCLTRFLGRYCGPYGITVNSINPNEIVTDPVKDLEDSPEGRVFLAETPMGRFGKVDDVAHAVAFLMSDGAGYITGHLLNLNGGRYVG